MARVAVAALDGDASLYSRRVVAYTALDVMLIATPLIGSAFGPMSEGLVNEQILPLCKTIDELYGAHGHCFRIEVVPAVGYWVAWRGRDPCRRLPSRC